MPVLNPKALLENRVTAIQDFHSSVGTKKAELDVSGGIDSAVELGLVCMALGARNVTAVYSDINSSDESRARAEEVAAIFDVQLIVLELTEWYDDLVKMMIDAYVKSHTPQAPSGPEAWASWESDFHEFHHKLRERIRKDPTILGSIRSCIRAPIGRGFNRIAGGGIRHGTGNECEDRWLRFYQKGGDGEVDCNPLAMLSKGEVYQLAVALGIPSSIIAAKPSPDLWGKGEEAHNDEDELLTWAGAPFTYSRVDPLTGEYTKVGTIERVSRYADDWPGIFDPDVNSMEALVNGSHEHPALAPLPHDLRKLLLTSARRVERMTRHKWNPNCPSLGTREDLVDSGILTNTLPDLSGEED